MVYRTVPTGYAKMKSLKYPALEVTLLTRFLAA